MYEWRGRAARRSAWAGTRLDSAISRPAAELRHRGLGQAKRAAHAAGQALTHARDAGIFSVIRDRGATGAMLALCEHERERLVVQ